MRRVQFSTSGADHFCPGTNSRGQIRPATVRRGADERTSRTSLQYSRRPFVVITLFAAGPGRSQDPAMLAAAGIAGIAALLYTNH